MRRMSVMALALALLLSGCEATPGAETARPAATPPPTTRPQWVGPTVPPSAEPESEVPEPMIPVDYDYSQTVPQGEPVEEDYFADAVFLGDSRVDGFRLYSGLTQADFIARAGMSVFKVRDDLMVCEGEEMTALEALERKEYGKVYVSLGINELGMRDDQGYYDCYAQLIDDIRARQPRALIYIQLLIPVNERRCAQKKVAYYVTNEQIAVYNGFLYQLAQEKQVLLVDPAQALTDETGQPPYDTVTDGVHFTKETYRRWLDYLKCHTVQGGERA